MHYGQLVHNVNLEKMWTDVHDLGEVSARQTAITQFNAENRYRKRGLAVVPVCYGINFGQPFLNQAGALVLIYIGTLIVCPCDSWVVGFAEFCANCVTVLQTALS